MEDPEGAFGRYTLLARIGEGGMGAVHRARDEKLGRLVALKVIRQRQGASSLQRGPTAEATARLLREARAAAALTHPHVVAIYDVGEHEGVPYIAMELVEGESVRRLLGKGIPLATRLGWLRQVADALRAAHELGIVHRDIKPDNVVIRDGVFAKVLDFGLARSTKESGRAEEDPVSDAERTASPDLATITRDGSPLGTPAYMAPEQIRGSKLDGRCDQFAWGVMAYEVLSGRLPWGEELNTLGVLAAILTEKAPPLVVEGLDERVGDVVGRAMTTSAANRFASMSDVMRALDAAMGLSTDEVATVPRGGSAPRTGGPASSPDPVIEVKTTLSSADTVLQGLNAMGVPTLASAGAGGGRAVEPAVRVSVAPPRRRRGRIIAVAVGAVAACALVVAVWPRSWGREAPAAMGSAFPSVPSAASTASSMAEPASDAPRTIDAEQAPTSTRNAEALALYRKARLLQRECDWTRARPLFEQVAALAPEMGEAHWQVANVTFYLNGYVVTDEVRQAYRRAVDARSTMNRRDRALVESAEPLLGRETPEWALATDTMQDLVAKYPRDAELLMRLAMFRTLRGEMQAVLPHIAAACELDPDYADAWQLRIYVEGALGKFDEATRSIATCHRLAPNSQECSIGATRVFAFTGQCEDAALEARRMAGSPSDGLEGPILLGLERPRALVESTFERGWAAHLALRGLQEPRDRWSIAMADGDFVAAQKHARQHLEAAAKDATTGELSRWTGVEMLATAAHEAGMLRAVDREIQALLAHANEWPRTGVFYADQSLAVAVLRRAAGLASADEVARTREAFRERFASTFATNPTAAWAAVDCQGVETAEQARAAVARAPATTNAGELMQQFDRGRTLIGIALHRAGDEKAAIPWLRGATRSCFGWQSPRAFIDAHRHLGEALEAEGDREGACEAYGFVLRHWGRAKPRSITAEAVRKRVVALKCPPGASAPRR